MGLAGWGGHIKSLFDVEEHIQFDAVRNMVVSAASRTDVHEFCKRWHYSKTGGNMTWNYGLWDGVVLVGCVSYNLPTMPAAESFFGKERWSWVTHMGRLVCAEDAPKNSESKLIAGSMKLLKKDYPVMRAVVTYAAASEGHIGYVYQATNALYLGTTQRKHFYIDERGQRRAPKQGKNLSMDKALARGWSVHHDSPKHRYLYLVGNRTEKKEALKHLQYEVLPYPKGEK